MKLFEELKRRNVFRVALGYIIAGWLVLQVTDVVIGLLELPSWIGRFVFYGVGLGFPLALVISWVFQLTPEGLKRDSDLTATDNAATATVRRLDIAIIVLLVLSLGFLAMDRFVLRENTGTMVLEEADSAPDWYEQSIAVIPFEARGDEDEGELFAQGIHDDLLTQLAKIADLHVISRTSVMEYAGTTKKIPKIGTELGVKHVLEGGVQKVGDQVRINVQLIDSTTDKHLWAETFDRELTVKNIFRVQSEIVGKITESLHATLLPETAVSIANEPTENLEAYRDYVTATSGDLERETRVELLRSAIEKDPQFAQAWLKLAYYLQQGFWFEGDQSALDQALEAQQRAEAIDPDLPELHLVRAVIEYHGFLNYEKALAELDLAEKVMPGNASNFYWRGTIYRHMGRLAEALKAYQRAFELDPRQRGTINDLGQTYLLNRNYGEARALYARSIVALPEFAWWSRWSMGMADWYQYGESSQLMRVMERPDWDSAPGDKTLMALIAWLDRDLDTALNYVRQIELQNISDYNLNTPPAGLDLVSEDIAIFMAGILMDSGAEVEARGILEASLSELMQEVSESENPPPLLLQKLAFVLALLGSNKAAEEVADQMVRRYEDEPVRATFPEVINAYHGWLMCHIGEISRAEEDFRSILSHDSSFTLASLTNGWPPCRKAFEDTENYKRLDQEYGHLSHPK